MFDYYVPPHSAEAEQSILGCMLLDADVVTETLDMLSVDDFYRSNNQRIFEAIAELNKAEEKIDMVTVSDRLKEKGQLHDIGGFEYLVQITSNVPIIANSLHYAKIVEEKSLLRKIVKTGFDISKMAIEQSDSPSEILQTAEKEILNINNKIPTELPTIMDAVGGALKELEERCNNKGKIYGLPTGFPSIDFKTGGLQKGDLIIIAGRPSMGKTTLAENIATYVGMKKRLPVAFFSMEMKKEKIINRAVSAESGVPNEKFKLGTVDEADWEKLTPVYQEIMQSKIVIDDTPNIKASEIRSKSRRIKKQYGNLALIVIDHLTEMWRPRKGNDRTEYEENIRAMKRLAREMDCPVILLQQLNRDVEKRQDKRPELSDLKETGAAEEVADVVIMLYRDDYYNPDTTKKGIADILFRKGRDIGVGTVEMGWNGATTKFFELSKLRG